MNGWQRIGGCAESPGVYDDGAGAIVVVERDDATGVVRRTRESYCGRGGDWVRFWPPGSSTGQHPAPTDGAHHATFGAALRAGGRQ